jgi:hypothetical protein
MHAPGESTDARRARADAAKYHASCASAFRGFVGELAVLVDNLAARAASRPASADDRGAPAVDAIRRLHALGVSLSAGPATAARRMAHAPTDRIDPA